MLYLAYCTLLDEQEMHRFVPGAQPRATGTMDGWRVGFAAHGRGCALRIDRRLNYIAVTPPSATSVLPVM